jgi:hypothetical protein
MERRDGGVGTDSANYTLQQPADVGKSFTCVVTATNAGGSTPAPPSNAVVAVEAAPGSGVPPGSGTGTPPAGSTDPVPPTQEQIGRAFKAVRQQAKFRDNRTKALEGCEHISGGLQEALALCNGPDAASHLADITDRVNWSIEHVGELRAAVEAAELPEPPAPPDLTVALTQDQVDAANRVTNAARTLTELRTNSLSQCDEVTTTLQICLQWCSEPDATDHMVEITGGVNGAIEQIARMRSSFGSTQTSTRATSSGAPQQPPAGAAMAMPPTSAGSGQRVGA